MNKEPIEERTQLTNGGEKNLSFELPNETPPKEKNKSFKKSYKKGLSEIELNKKQIISYARDSHQKGVISKLFQFYEYDLFDNVLSPFIEKYPFELIKKFYIYSIETNRPIDVRITEEAFLKWQNLGTPEVPLAESEPEVPLAEAEPEVPLAKADLFNELCDEVKTYLNSLPKHQLKLQKMDLQKIGIQKYEEYILPLIARIKRKNKYNKSNNIQENFNKYTSIGG